MNRTIVFFIILTLIPFAAMASGTTVKAAPGASSVSATVSISFTLPAPHMCMDKDASVTQPKKVVENNQIVEISEELRNGEKVLVKTTVSK